MCVKNHYVKKHRLEQLGSKFLMIMVLCHCAVFAMLIIAHQSIACFLIVTSQHYGSRFLFWRNVVNVPHREGSVLAVILLDLSHVWALIVQTGSVGERTVLVKDDVTVYNARAL